MTTRNSQLPTKSGFTLVELSIVLVIIGLLIGGVLVGQSLTESAKTNRLVSDLKQYEIAVVQFHKKFKKYPGDSKYFIPPGNGDGWLALRSTCAAVPNASFGGHEIFQFWAHLSQSKMLSKTYPTFSPSSCGGSHYPIYSDERNAGIWPYVELEGTAVALAGSSKYLITPSQRQGGHLYLYFYTNPLDTLAIEKKLGTQDYDDSETQIGLTNLAGSGLCGDEFDNIAPCGSATAAYGYLYYYIAPQ